MTFIADSICKCSSSGSGVCRQRLWDCDCYWNGNGVWCHFFDDAGCECLLMIGSSLIFNPFPGRREADASPTKYGRARQKAVDYVLWHNRCHLRHRGSAAAVLARHVHHRGYVIAMSHSSCDVNTEIAEAQYHLLSLLFPKGCRSSQL